LCLLCKTRNLWENVRLFVFPLPLITCVTTYKLLDVSLTQISY
jgi:hypothetical protein